VLWQLIGMLAVVSAIAVSIALHEFGHLIPAKRFGVRVSDYAIGFGPSLYSRRFGETLFAIRAIPLGGFIRMIGMYPPARRAPGAGRFSKLVEEARSESMSEVLPSDAGRTFYELPLHKRVVVMLGGPFMNLLFATLLFGMALVGIGVAGPSTTIDKASPCWFTTKNPDGLLAKGSSTCGAEQSAASQAGLRKGQTLVAVDGLKVADWSSLSSIMETVAKRGHAGTVTVRNADGSESTHKVTFQFLTFDRYDDAGNKTGETFQRAIIGVTSVWEQQHLPISTIPRVMWSMTTSSLHAMSQFPVKVYELGNTLITNGKRDPNGPVSVVGVTRIGGEIAAAPTGVSDKLLSLLMLAGSLNLFLFLFNLLPLLPLDGGHVAAALWEAVRDGVRKLRRRSAGGPVDTARLLPFTYAMSTLLIGFGALVIWADIVKPITLG
jgi:membrane-associated protease RseP (regulator of RpoE activity)